MKNKTFSIYALVLLVSFALFFIFILTIPIFGWESVNKFIQGHGSLFGGLLGFAGVFILIKHQSEATERVIDSNMRILMQESLEIRRARAIDYLAVLKRIFQTVEDDLRVGRTLHQRWAKNALSEEVEGAEIYLRHFFKEDEDVVVICLDVIARYVLFYKEKNWEKFKSQMLAALTVLELSYDDKMPSFFHTTDAGDFIEDPGPFLDRSHLLGKDDSELELFFASYTNKRIIRGLEKYIELKKLPV